MSHAVSIKKTRIILSKLKNFLSLSLQEKHKGNESNDNNIFNKNKLYFE